MAELFKYLWRYVKSLSLRKHNVYVSHSARFNQHTSFEKNIKIGKHTCVCNAVIGRNSYIGRNSNFNDCEIGRFCSIASNVKVEANTHPSSTFVSTSPSFYSTLLQNGQTFVAETCFEETLQIDGKKLIVGNDVWIGADVIFKGGIKIGDGAIVAMGAVVTKDVPPYSIVGGVPAKIIRYRFSDEQIAKLRDLQWWNKNDEWLKKNAKMFDNVETFFDNFKNETI